MTSRRSFLSGVAAAGLLHAGAGSSRLAVEAYIFQQYARQRNRSLADVLPDVIPMARAAGFHNIELNAEFFTPACRERALMLVRANNLRMPSVYSGGPLHDPALAAQTIARALEIAETCRPFGCSALVCNADPKGEGVEKTSAELAVQAAQMNRMGRELRARGFALRVHNHTPEMLSGAREWRFTLQHSDPRDVSLCLDLDWVHQGGEDPLALLKEAGSRVSEIHVRNSRGKLWLEDLEQGDVDYTMIASYLQKAGLEPLVVVELAYRPQTQVTRSLEDDLRRTRLYAERVFSLT